MIDKIVNYKTQCPKCGYYISTYPQYVVTPKQKEEFLLGTLFDIKCPDCGETSRVFEKSIYHDKENNFAIVCHDTPAHIAKEVKKQLEYMDNIIFDDFCVPAGTTVIGALTHGQACSVITAFDVGYDWRIVLMRHYELELKYTKKYGTCHIALMKTDEGIFFFVVPEKEGVDNIIIPFNKRQHDQRLVKYISALNKLNPHMMTDFMYELIIDVSKGKAIPDLTRRFTIFCGGAPSGFEEVFAPCFIEDEVEVTDTVIAYDVDNDKEDYFGLIEKYNFNQFEYPVNPERMPTIMTNIGHFEYSNKFKPEVVDDNDEVMSKLLEIKKNNYEYSDKTLPFKLLEKSLFLTSYKRIDDYKGPFRLFDETGEEKIETTNFEIGGNNNVKLLSLYSKPELCDCGDGKTVLPFDLCVKIVKDSPYLDGISIDKYNFNMDRKMIFNYIVYKTMADHDNMIEFLDNLTAKEKDYIGDQPLSFIKQVYFEGKTPEVLAEENKLTKEEVGDILDKGYMNMMDIVYSKF